jgi:hypothetical protein
MQAIRDHVEQTGGAQQGVLLSAGHFRHALEAVMRASQYARTYRLLREASAAERTPVEQQRSISEAKPMPHQTSPLS